MHCDMQPTNILIKPDGHLALIDFEKSAIGNYYYDIASTHHRAESSLQWQNDFLHTIVDDLSGDGIKFNQELFELYHHYFILLDLVSLNLVYIQKQAQPYHGTFLKEGEAKELFDSYKKKFDQYID